MPHQLSLDQYSILVIIITLTLAWITDPKSDGSHMYALPTTLAIFSTVYCSSDLSLYRLHSTLIGTMDRFVFDWNAFTTMLDAVCGSLGYIYKCNVDFEDIFICGTNLNRGSELGSSKILLRKSFIADYLIYYYRGILLYLDYWFGLAFIMFVMLKLELLIILKNLNLSTFLQTLYKSDTVKNKNKLCFNAIKQKIIQINLKHP